MFPIRHTRRVANRVKLTNEFNVYCTDTPETHWIQCSHCREWLHIALCVVVPEQALDPQIAWCVVSVNSYDIQNHYFTMLFFNLCSYRHKGKGESLHVGYYILVVVMNTVRFGQLTKKPYTNGQMCNFSEFLKAGRT